MADPYHYFHGVAVNVLREYWRDRERADAPLDETAADSAATPEIDVAQRTQPRRSGTGVSNAVWDG